MENEDTHEHVYRCQDCGEIQNLNAEFEIIHQQAFNAGIEAALGALPEELVYAKDMTYSEEMVLSYNHALSAAKLKIEKLYNSSHAHQAQKEEKDRPQKAD